MKLISIAAGCVLGFALFTTKLAPIAPAGGCAGGAKLR